MAIASFAESLVPMVIIDDRRRCVGVNRAMCLLLRISRKSVLRMRIDDLIPPEAHPQMLRRWAELMRDGVQSGMSELLAPDGPRMLVEYSALANVRPGRHLLAFALPWADVVLTEPADLRPLSEREREVLALVAMGESGTEIARALGISPATVESHVRNILGKLEAKNRTHAIALAIRRDEISMNLGPPSEP